MAFAKVLVTKWLREHKFKNWLTHRTHNPGTPVTDGEREARAKEIADKLCNHSEWLSHGRSIKLSDLVGIGLEITDYSKMPRLADAIRRYHALLQMTFETTNMYKIVETPASQIYRFALSQQIQVTVPSGIPFPPPGGPVQPGQQRPPAMPGVAPAGAVVQFVCNKCKKAHMLQADFDRQRPLQPGTERFPGNDILICDQCQTSHNLLALRRQLELQTKRKVAQ